MTTTTTHTPTPWHVNTKIRNKIYVEAASAFICDMQADEQGDTIENFAAIDAAHLVRCVNEREDLLEALRSCIAMIRAELHDEKPREDIVYEYKRVSAVLARAEEG